jgi:hypothetical protein
LNVLMPVVLMICIFAQGVTCTPMYAVAAAIYAIVGIISFVFRPHRNFIVNYFQGSGMILNSILLGINAALVMNPLDRTTESGTRFITLLQVGLTALRLFHSIVSTLLFLKFRSSWFERVSPVVGTPLAVAPEGDEMGVVPLYDVKRACNLTPLHPGYAPAVGIPAPADYGGDGGFIALPLQGDEVEEEDRATISDSPSTEEEEIDDTATNEDGLTGTESRIVEAYVHKVRHYDDVRGVSHQAHPSHLRRVVPPDPMWAIHHSASSSDYATSDDDDAEMHSVRSSL